MGRWREQVFASYPPERTQFLKTKNDPFGNPVGFRINEGLEGIFDALFGKGTDEEIPRFLDDIIRIRAVQEFSPSEAVDFLFVLKDVIREELEKEVRDGEIPPDWRELDRRIDRLALAGFELYAQCREKLFEIRVQEVKNLSYLAMKRANLVCDISEVDPRADTGDAEDGE